MISVCTCLCSCVGTGGGNADVTGMAPDGDPVSFADSWSKNNWFCNDCKINEVG